MSHYAVALARQEGILFVHYVEKDIKCEEEHKVFEASYKDNPLKSQAVWL